MRFSYYIKDKGVRQKPKQKKQKTTTSLGKKIQSLQTWRLEKKTCNRES